MYDLSIFLLGKLTKIKKETIKFVIDSQKIFNKKMMVLIPFTFFSTLIGAIVPLTFKYLIDIFSGGLKSGISILDNNKNTLFVIGLVISVSFTLKCLEIIGNMLNSLFTSKLEMESGKIVEDRFFNKISEFDLSFLSGENNLQLIRSISSASTSLQTTLISFIMKLVSLPTSMISLFIIVPLLHPYLLVMMLVSAVISISFDMFKSSLWRKRELLLQRNNDKRHSYKWSIISNFSSFNFNGLLPKMMGSYRQIRQKSMDSTWKQDKETRLISLFQDLLDQLLANLMIFASGFLVISGSMSVGTFALVPSYRNKLESLFYSIGNFIRDLIQINLKLWRVQFLLILQSKLIDLDNLKPDNFKIKSLEIRNLNFKYPQLYEDEKKYFIEFTNKVNGVISTEIDKNATKPGFVKRIWKKIANSNTNDWQKDELKEEMSQVLQMFEIGGGKAGIEGKNILENVNFKFEIGRIYGIVGENGAGKTTLVSLLKRALDPSIGEILVNGNLNLRSIDRDFYRKNLVAIEQKSINFDGLLNVRDLLILNATRVILDSEIWTVLQELGIKEKISSLDLILGEGVQLSGGQIQLLQIARVLLAQKPVNFLDEGTNQLDAIKEMNVIRLMQKYLKNSITIFITHRMSTCKYCDTILTVENGKVGNTGTPKELLELENGNIFEVFWKAQMTL